MKHVLSGKQASVMQKRARVARNARVLRIPVKLNSDKKAMCRVHKTNDDFVTIILVMLTVMLIKGVPILN